MVPPMNFLSHLWLAGDDDGLRLGALLGDFVRGSMDNSDFPLAVQKGILLHRFTDQYMDGLPDLGQLRQQFQTPFRRYAGIIIDVAFDHQLAKRWDEFSSITLQQFDRDVREVLRRHEHLLPDDLRGFMRYADRRGLFSAYQHKDEILYSLAGIGRRLSRPNPLHRVDEIWNQLEAELAGGFDRVFPQVQDAVTDWLAAISTPGERGYLRARA